MISPRYDRFTYLAPPRTALAVPPGALSLYQKKGWWAQAKKNGTNSVVFVSPKKELTAMNRHGEEHKQWSFTEGSSRIFRALPGSGWFVVNCELMHSKVPGIRDVNYVHDVLVADGKLLTGTTYAQRYGILQSLFLKGAVAEERTHWVLDDHTWLARNIRDDFRETFDSLEDPADEGLVLKRPVGLYHLSDGKGSPWAVKCRVRSKNLGF